MPRHSFNYANGSDSRLGTAIKASSPGLAGFLIAVIGLFGSGARAEATEAALAELLADPTTWVAGLSSSSLAEAPEVPSVAMERLSGHPYSAWQSELDASARARAHLDLGHRLRQEGRSEAAFGHYELASRVDSELGEAHLALATLAGQLGRYRQSARAFAWLAELDPEDPRAFSGRALALRRLGHHRLAASVLDEALAKWPDDPRLADALARLLAASPNDAVRDGERAVVLAQHALQTGRQAIYAETLAMAFAEAGRHSDAVSLVRTLIERARASGDTSGLVDTLEEQAKLYAAGQAYRLNDRPVSGAPSP